MPLTDSATDLALLRALNQGSRAAFSELYLRHHGPLYRFALVRGGSRELAQDLTQELFMGLFTGAYPFDASRGTLQNFLFGVLRKLLLKRNSQLHVRNEVPLDLEDEADEGTNWIPDPAQCPVTRLLANDRAERVRVALAALPPHYREVVILYELHELSYVEIAAICGVEIGTVRSRLSRARAHLASSLADEIDEHLRPPKVDATLENTP